MRHLRAAAAPSAPTEVTDPAEAVTLRALEQRIAHLEEQLRGLQDSVHRENVRHTGRLAHLAARTEPAAIAVALEKDARERGL
ncbi:MAG TPA: hypothetical protein VG295_14265 [Solirubrobacteraceae bacterium]|nr:hypothetical protein [Solirubrobacteraceae bacterium]